MRGRHIIQRLLQLRTVTAEMVFDQATKTYFLSGNTFPIKDKLKKLGFKWNPAKKMWYTKKEDAAQKGEALLEAEEPPKDREPTAKQIAFAVDLVNRIAPKWTELYKGKLKKPPTKDELWTMSFKDISKFIDELMNVTKNLPTPKQVAFALDLFREVGLEGWQAFSVGSNFWQKEKSLPTADDLQFLSMRELSSIIDRLKAARYEKKKQEIAKERATLPPTRKQIDYALTLLGKVDWLATDDGLSMGRIPPDKKQIENMSRDEVSWLIDNLKTGLPGYSYGY